MNPLDNTALGVTAWAVVSGRWTGQRTGLRHLTWAGPGDAIHLHADGVADGHTEHPGRDIGTVSGPCQTAAEAQQAVDAYLLGLTQERAGTPARAQGAEDETARILAGHGTPGQRYDYALMEAAGRKRGAYAAAWAQYEATGRTAAAKQHYDAAYEAAHAGWTAEVASAAAGYAREIDATAAAASFIVDDPTSPYNQGWRNGVAMLIPEILTHRPNGYSDRKWREFVAGYAEAAQLHAETTAAYARAVQEQAQENPAESLHQSASSGTPCTVTGYFATNVGPTLHYTLASAAGDVLDYSRDPDGNVAAQVQVSNHWIDLAEQDPRYQAVIQGVREHEARNPDLAGYNNPQAASTERHGNTPGGITQVPATIALSQLRDLERTAPDGTPATVKFRRGQQLQPGDVISGQRDPWAVVTHITWSGPEVAIRVQEAGGSRTMTTGTPGPSLDVRTDLRVDPSTCPDIPDGFPPRWGVWRSGPGQPRETTTWFPQPGQAAQHARQASQDGNECVVELESPNGSWTQVDAYQQGRRSAWGTQLAAGQAKTVMPPWATPGPVPAAQPGAKPARRPAQHRRQPSGPAPRRTP